MVITLEQTKIRVTLEGIAPGLLYQSKGLMEREGKKKTKPKTAEEEAPYRGHWIGNGKKPQIAVPWVMLHKSFCQAAQDFKHTGRKNMSPLVGSTVACKQDLIPIDPNKYEVYEDWVRIPPKTGPMVKIGRPLMREWKINFVMEVDGELWTPEVMLAEVIPHAGKMVGIGAWRPGLKGPYGRFVMTDFKVID